MRSHLFLLLSLFLPVANAFQNLATTTTTTSARRHLASSSRLMMAVDPGQAWQAYNDALNTSPLLVKSVTAGVILGAADLAGQAVQDAQREGDETTDIDIARTVRFAFFGLALQAPWNHFLLPTAGRDDSSHGRPLDADDRHQDRHRSVRPGADFHGTDFCLFGIPRGKEPRNDQAATGRRLQ